MVPVPVPGIVILRKLLIAVGLEPRKALLARKMHLERWYASLSSEGREVPVVTRYLEMKVEVVVDNKVRGRKVNVRVYTSIDVVAAAAEIAGVAAVVGGIAAAMKLYHSE